MPKLPYTRSTTNKYTGEEVYLQRGGPDNRGPRYACSHRERPIEESLTEFRAMRDSKYKAREAYLRMKQSLTNPNEGSPQMWDLPARVVEKNRHHRTSNKWNIYPTSDFTHCLCDAFEKISHSMCTTEFQQSRVSGCVRLQKRQIESELKVRQKGRVPSRFDTRLWLYGLHGRVQI